LNSIRRQTYRRGQGKALKSCGQMRHEQLVTMTAAGDYGYFTNGHVPKPGGIGDKGQQPMKSLKRCRPVAHKAASLKTKQKKFVGTAQGPVVNRLRSTFFFLGHAEATPFTESNRKVSSCYFYTDQLTPLDYPEMLNYSKYLFKFHLTSKVFSFKCPQRRILEDKSIV
jgi:hypothetical protein